MKSYATSDTEEAAFLWCQSGISFNESTVTKDRKRSVVTFHFSMEETVDVEALRKDFYNEEASVEPKKFIRKLNDVKSILYAELKSK